MEIFWVCLSVAVLIVAVGGAVFLIGRSGLERQESPLERMLNTPVETTRWETKTVYSPLDKTAKPVDVKAAEKQLNDSLDLLGGSFVSKKSGKVAGKQAKDADKLKDLTKNMGLNLD